MPKYDLVSIGYYLVNSHLNALHFEAWSVVNLYANKLEQAKDETFFVGDVISLPDNDMIIVMLPNYVDKLLALCMLLNILPEDVQSWLDGMLAETDEIVYNESNSEVPIDTEVQDDEDDTQEVSQEISDIGIIEE